MCKWYEISRHNDTEIILYQKKEWKFEVITNTNEFVKTEQYTECKLVFRPIRLSMGVQMQGPPPDGMEVSDCANTVSQSGNCYL